MSSTSSRQARGVPQPRVILGALTALSVGTSLALTGAYLAPQALAADAPTMADAVISVAVNQNGEALLAVTENGNTVVNCEAADLPAGFNVFVTNGGCGVDGFSADPIPAADHQITLRYTDPDNADAGEQTITANVNIEVFADDDGDGVRNDVDQCPASKPQTPAAPIVVDENGCSAAPTLTRDADLFTSVGTFFTEEFAIDNPGRFDITSCTADPALPDGVFTVSLRTDSGTDICTVYGDPRVVSPLAPYTLTIAYTDDKGEAQTVQATANIQVQVNGDSDGDQVNDFDSTGQPLDLCSNTPAGALVDSNGCPVFAQLLADDAVIKGVVGQELEPVVIPVQNEGLLNVSCEADLPKGLNITKVDTDEGLFCVISGTPEITFEGTAPVAIVYFNPADPNVLVVVEAKIPTTIVAPEKDKDDKVLVKAEKDNKGLPATGVGGSVLPIAAFGAMAAAAAGVVARRRTK